MKNIISKSGEKSLSQKCDKKINLIKINSIVDKYLEKTLKKTLKNIKNNTINNINLQNGGVSFCAGTTQCVYLNPYDCHSTNMSGGKVKKKIQSGGAISLPSEYFGGVSGRYFESGSPNLGSTSHSFGHNMNTNNGFGGLDPHIAGNKVTEFQTGGGIKKSKKKIQSGGAISLPSEYFGGVSGRYFESGSPNLGSTSHSFGYNMNTNNGFGGLDPHIAGNKVTEFQTGGGKIKNKKGGATVLPSEYFGGISGRYYELGDPKLGVNSSSFGSSPIKNNSLITSLDKIHIGGTSQESDPSLKIGSTPNINSTAHACSSCGPSCTTALFAGGAVTNNMFNDIKSLFNKKIFNELILIKLKKLNKEDVVITENAKDKLRFLTEIYLMKKLFCN
jgi:hypothetical protein